MTVSQTQLQTLLLPRLKESDIIYQKFRAIHAHIAEGSEVITTIIDDKVETQNIAEAGDYIVKNLTRSEEMYIVPKEKFPRLYQFSKNIDDSWDAYIPKGQIKALEVTPQVLSLLEQTSPFLILAPWGEEQQVEIHDYLVTPLAKQNEIYRVARSAFGETYQPIT
ncbi:MAG: Unknown protein [uncultured Thiotrichaceae bacterium]|uniref:Uncharacterized protein n=1 Tax=uncultured Thiotrichaceae bacterium TaxID=298394 RepID=A0A6S6UA92_9GAMM|nr:MAG: Unknown protein [uncultured Thiotrichaceae bacterium]